MNSTTGLWPAPIDTRYLFDDLFSSAMLSNRIAHILFFHRLTASITPPQPMATNSGKRTTCTYRCHNGFLTVLCKKKNLVTAFRAIVGVPASCTRFGGRSGDCASWIVEGVKEVGDMQPIFNIFIFEFRNSNWFAACCELYCRHAAADWWLKSAVK